MPGIFGAACLATLRGSRESQPLGGHSVRELADHMAAAMCYDPSASVRLVHVADMGICVGQVEATAEGTTTAPTLDGLNQRSTALVTGEWRRLLPVNGPGPDTTEPKAPKPYAAVVVDRAARACLLHNDSLGRERIFLYRAGDLLLFSSEAKAILAAAPETRALDPRGIAEFLACGCTLGTQSLFRSVRVLEPGTFLRLDADGVRMSRPFAEEHFEGVEKLPEDAFIEQSISVLRAEVRRLVSSSPSLGISLTGGLDSRMVMASLDADCTQIPSYTFGSMYRTTGDVAVARRVAAACGHRHQTIELGREFLSSCREEMQRSVYISDGYLGLSGAAELHVNRRARAIGAARMTGNWGGEVMRGVRAFKFTAPRGGFLTPTVTRAIAESSAAFVPPAGDPLSGTLFHQVPLQGYGRYAIERSQVTMCTPFLAPAVIETLYRGRIFTRASLATARTIIGQRPPLVDIPTDAGLLGRHGQAMRRSWRKAVIKAEYLTSHGAPDWMARLGASLPGFVLDTRFLGVDKFYHFRRWTRRELAPFVRETVAAEATGPLVEWFDMRRVSQMVEEHIAGRANHTDALDKVLTLGVARQVLLSPGAFAVPVGAMAGRRDAVQP